MQTPKEKQDLLVMKLLHYFITKQNYNPVIVHGIENEIWLENMDSEFRLVRIVMNYIHNEEQLNFDRFKVKKLARQIKLKTFSFKMKTLSLYLDLNSDINIENTKNHYLINVTSEKVFKNNEIIKDYFSDMPSNLKFTEEGEALYKKINNDILKSNMDKSEKINDLFMPKKPIVTYTLIGIMIFIFLLMYVFGSGSNDIKTLLNFGALIKEGGPIRLFTSMFLHIGFLHLFMNCWAFKILGEQAERFYGHFKLFIIFLYSGVVGNLLSMILMNEQTISAGASGAIFGIMGAILYFSINQRTYMGEALKSYILPVIIMNLFLGFLIPGINMVAHIGGLIGGMLISSTLGIKYKTSRFEKINGWICSILLVGILTYFVYFI